MRTIDELLAEHPFFAGFDSAATQLIAGCAWNEHYALDQYLMHEGGEADRFFVIRHGRVALELASPGHDRLVVDTCEDGDVVGWSWLIPPYRWSFDARAVDPTSVVTLDGACLRAKCEADPKLGYQMMQRVAQVMMSRLTAARLQLLDLHRNPGAHVA